jgi:hypothetical protein
VEDLLAIYLNDHRRRPMKALTFHVLNPEKSDWTRRPS